MIAAERRALLEELRPRIPAPPDGPPPAFRTPQVAHTQARPGTCRSAIAPRPDGRAARAAAAVAAVAAGAPVTLMALLKAVPSLYLPAIETKRTVKP